MWICVPMVMVTWEPCRQLCTSPVSLRGPQPFAEGRPALRYAVPWDQCLLFVWWKEHRMLSSWPERDSKEKEARAAQSSFKHWPREEGYSGTWPLPLSPILFPETRVLNFWAGIKDGPHFPSPRLDTGMKMSERRYPKKQVQEGIFCDSGT